jgi:VIT1/CCC1 family predicted Fe2+/Mn2+ transporter
MVRPMSNFIAAYQKRYMSYGSWLAEWLYGFIMVAVVTGMINGFGEVALTLFRWEITVWLIVITFGVNIAWGLIDGLTVIYGGLTDKADQEKLIGKLKKDGKDPELRPGILDLIEGSVAGYLPDEKKQRLVDDIIEEGPEAKRMYRLTREDGRTLLAIASCDILAVIPVILPFIVLGFTGPALTLSRLIAASAIGWIVYKYAEHTGRRKWVAAAVFFVLTLVMMSVTWYYGW